MGLLVNVVKDSGTCSREPRHRLEKASVTLSTVPYIKKGSMPKRENKTHDSATTRKVSRSCMVFFFAEVPM